MTHRATVVNAYGVAPDAAGVVRLRVVGFRGHCETCGWLTPRLDNFFAARGRAERHVRSTENERPAGPVLDGHGARRGEEVTV